MPPLFAEEADSTAEAPRFRARAGCFQMLSTDEGYAVAVNPSGAAAYVLGATDGLSLPTSTGAKQPTFGGSTDLFVATFLVP